MEDKHLGSIYDSSAQVEIHQQFDHEHVAGTEKSAEMEEDYLS